MHTHTPDDHHVPLSDAQSPGGLDPGRGRGPGGSARCGAVLVKPGLAGELPLLGP